MVFSGGLCSKHNTFSRAAGVRRTQSRNFFHGSISFAKTVPTRYRTPANSHACPNKIKMSEIWQKLGHEKLTSMLCYGALRKNLKLTPFARFNRAIFGAKFHFIVETLNMFLPYLKNHRKHSRIIENKSFRLKF